MFQPACASYYYLCIVSSCVCPCRNPVAVKRPNSAAKQYRKESPGLQHRGAGPGGRNPKADRPGAREPRGAKAKDDKVRHQRSISISVDRIFRTTSRCVSCVAGPATYTPKQLIYCILSDCVQTTAKRWHCIQSWQLKTAVPPKSRQPGGCIT